jgi:vanillate monooxygenase
MPESAFLRNQWYAVATGAEIGRAPFARTVCGQPLVLFRRTDGRLAALDDRCPHRLAPLSKGEVIGDELQCGYHGLRFDGAGACTLIPSQSTVPRGFAARSFPVVEKFALVFVWMGEPAAADPALLPDFPENDQPGWTALHGYLHVNADYRLLMDNLLDLTHVQFVHKTTLGGPGMAENPLEVESDGDRVRTRRIMRNVEPAPIHGRIRKFTGRIDRAQHSEFRPPAYIHIRLGAIPAGSNEEFDPAHHVVINSLTPETDRTTHYLWSVARWMAADDEGITDWLRDIHMTAFAEDIDIIEAQQRMIDADPSTALANLEGDKAAAAMRRILARKLAAEAGPATVA